MDDSVTPAAAGFSLVALEIAVACGTPRAPGGAPTAQVPMTTEAVETARASPTASSANPADAGPTTAEAPAAIAAGPEAGAPQAAPAGSAPSAPMEDPWIGLTKEDVRAIVRGTHPTHSLNGHPKLSIRGETWSIEYEPGGCSDWALRLTLRFSRGKVVAIEHNHHGRWTGKYCL